MRAALHKQIIIFTAWITPFEFNYGIFASYGRLSFLHAEPVFHTVYNLQASGVRKSEIDGLEKKCGFVFGLSVNIYSSLSNWQDWQDSPGQDLVKYLNILVFSFNHSGTPAVYWLSSDYLIIR